MVFVVVVVAVVAAAPVVFVTSHLLFTVSKAKLFVRHTFVCCCFSNCMRSSPISYKSLLISAQ